MTDLRVHPGLSEDACILRDALRPLCDVVDPEEGPVILAWALDALACAVDDRLAKLGYELRRKGNSQ